MTPSRYDIYIYDPITDVNIGTFTGVDMDGQTVGDLVASVGYEISQTKFGTALDHSIVLQGGVTNPVYKYVATISSFYLDGIEYKIGGDIAWGNISGTLSDQTDLNTALEGKQATLVSGTNIKTINSTSILGNGNIDINQVSDTAYSSSWDGVTTTAPSKNAVYDKINAMDTTISNKANTSDVLTKTNTTEFTPTGHYQPATKKYVDDNISAATGGAVSDEAYGASWDGVTGIAPSKNAVYDKISSMDTAISGKQAQHSSITVTLTSSGWSSNTQTVTATGVTASNSVICSPTPASITDYTGAQIYCSAQGSNSLTFTCDTVPSSDITVNVIILN